MTSSGSHETRNLTKQTSEAKTLAEQAEIQRWLDNGDWNPLDGPPDVQICWKLLSDPASQSAATEQIFFTPQSSGRPQNASAIPARFTPKAKMGMGGFGVVLQVYDHYLQRKITLKILRPSLGKPPKLISRFVREARAVAALEHPGIVRVFETGSIGGQPFIAGELVEGPNLAKYFQKGRAPLSVRQAVWLMREIATAVQFAHSRGVLHRDLKPSNILLSPCTPEESEGLAFKPRLTDFGLAKRIDIDANTEVEKEVEEDLTENIQILGTVRYMSPEQASGKLADVAIGSDVFSLGVILFELLTGKVPFDAPSDSEVLHRICHDLPPRPRKLIPKLPRELESIVLKALEKDPANRYSSAGAMKEDLDRFLSGEPVNAAPYSLRKKVMFLARKHPVMSLIVTASIVAMLAATTFSTRSWISERRARQAEQAAMIREKAAQRTAQEAQNGALHALNNLFFTLVEKVNDGKPIAHAERITMLRDALEFHKTYVEESPLDRQKRHRLSLAYHHLGNAIAQLNSIETMPEIEDARRNTLRILNSLLAETPDHPKLTFQKSIALCNLAYPLAALERPEESQACLRESHTIMNNLAAKFPDDITYADAANHSRIYVALLESDAAQANALLQQTVTSSLALWHAHPDQPQLAKHAVTASLRLSSAKLEKNLIDEAYAESKKSFQFFEEAFQPVRGEHWVKLIERSITRLQVRILLRLGLWSELAALTKHGYDLEQVSELTEAEEVVAANRIFQLYLLAFALQQLGQNEEAEAAKQKALNEESQFAHPRVYLDALLNELAQVDRRL